MATYYRVKPGYGSGFLFCPTPAQILAVAQSITTEEILAQARHFDHEHKIPKDSTFAENYTEIPTDDLRVHVDDDGVFGVASGGNDPEAPWRYWKEVFQAAFFFLVVQKCLQRGYSVSLIIS